MEEMDSWTALAMKVQSLAQNGLAYANNPFDRERYTELRRIAAEMLSCCSGVPSEQIQPFFCSETGYQTPKVDTRAAILQDGKILLVRERNDTWSLPGGWCDVDQSIASNTVKEVKEETGLDVYAQRLIAVQDWREHNVCNLPYGILKAFVLCRVLGGAFQQNPETTEFRFFERDKLPQRLADEKSTAEQIHMCFKAAESPYWETCFD